jgi:hypothetical protein
MSRLSRFILSATVLGIASVPAALVSAQPAPDSTASDPRAVAIADRVMETLGGKSRWDALVGLRWSFESARNDTVLNTRRHSWNKHTGWHRVSGTGRDGAPFVFIHNLNTGEGRAWMGGQEIQGDSLAKLLTRAKAIWINDTYWLLMPYKLRDPGVTLGYADTVRTGDQVCDKVALSFRNVGNTPGDRYWVHVDRATGRVVKWEMVLQGNQPPPVAYAWEGWEQKDGLWFATAKRGAEGRTIYTRSLEAVATFPAEEFSAP